MKLIAALTAILTTFSLAFGQHVAAAKVTFSSGTVAEMPFRIANNLVIIDATVNGAKGNFIFDTGAESTVIDTAFAAKLGLKQSGKTTGNGSAGSATAGVMKGAKVQLGGLATGPMTLYSLPLDSFVPSFGFSIDGIIGNDITGAVVAEIDYKNNVLRLIQPDSFKPSTSAEMLPLTVSDGLVFIRTEVTPMGGHAIPARMEIDTGSTGAVLLNAPFVRKNDIIKTLSNSIENKTGGVGGTGTSVIGRLAAIRFGSHSLNGPIVVLYTGNKGDSASSAYDGLIGGGIFRRFKVTVDMPGKRLFLEPGMKVNEPFDMDMSGLEILADGPDLKTYLVDEVRPGSAGATAGIEGGDKIQAIDGRSTAEIGLEEIHRLMRQDGASYELILDRNGKAVHVRLVLKRVL